MEMSPLCGRSTKMATNIWSPIKVKIKSMESTPLQHLLKEHNISVINDVKNKREFIVIIRED